MLQDHYSGTESGPAVPGGGSFQRQGDLRFWIEALRYPGAGSLALRSELDLQRVALLGLELGAHGVRYLLHSAAAGRDAKLLHSRRNEKVVILLLRARDAPAQVNLAIHLHREIQTCRHQI